MSDTKMLLMKSFFQLMHSNMKMASAMGTTTKVGFSMKNIKIIPATFFF